MRHTFYFICAFLRNDMLVEGRLWWLDSVPNGLLTCIIIVDNCLWNCKLVIGLNPTLCPLTSDMVSILWVRVSSAPRPALKSELD